MTAIKAGSYNIEHLLVIKTASSIVYEALTTQNGLAEVWTRELIVKPVVGFVNEFRFGKDVDKMKITRLTENRLIVWDVIDSDPEWIGTVISFALEEKNGATVITLKQEKWREVTDFYRSCNYNWGFFLLSLKSYCEKGKGMPYQEREF